jgi:predicted nucleotidyltransferase
MNSKELLKIKNRISSLLKNKEIEDVILFGSYAKGRESAGDIDILILSDKDIKKEYKGFHLTTMSIRELFMKFPVMINTVLKEGYSLRYNRKIAEYFKFSNKVLFSYDLSGLNASEKVKIVNILHGKNKEKGMVEQNGGEWIANRVFIIPPESGNVFEKFFINFKIKFNRRFLLMH